MKMNEILPNGCIGDKDVGYIIKVERYTTLMSDMKELDERLHETAK